MPTPDALAARFAVDWLRSDDPAALACNRVVFIEALSHLIREAVLEERERCARLVSDFDTGVEVDGLGGTVEGHLKRRIAAAIRGSDAT